ncbi:zona pellucida sperm-binding protein 3 receptor-like isoform X3 [Narcine bancroftii]|uniref:zona pellucida sperm-binding protein 3 receptor-like isoform X3 n=1 Tax=Narcine bancroftii TaxID=1343680 RepID=UPI003831602C
MLLEITLKMVLLFGLFDSTVEDCKPPASFENGFMKYLDSNDSKKVMYECNPGFTIRGSRVQTCVSNRWSGKSPVCKPKTCGNPGEILNGWANYTSNEFGSKVTFHCEMGFILIGKNYRLCEASGWSGQVPTCEHIECKPPIQPKNSEILSGFGFVLKYQESIIYQCKHGFGMIGSSVIECAENSRFEPDPPICKLTGCYQPKRVYHASIMKERPVYAREEIITYSCNRGYQLHGRNKIICLGNDEFDYEPPSCWKVKCMINWDFSTGKIRPHKMEYEYRDYLTFSCNTGYKLIGQTKSTCHADGNLHPAPPICRRIYCKIQVDFKNGKISPMKSQYVLGELLTFSCNDGYQLEGENESKCVQENTLEPLPPICKKVNPDLMSIQNLLMHIISLSRNILQDKNRSIQLEYQLLNIEESMLSKNEEIHQRMELFINKTRWMSPS